MARVSIYDDTRKDKLMVNDYLRKTVGWEAMISRRQTQQGHTADTTTRSHQCPEVEK